MQTSGSRLVGLAASVLISALWGSAFWGSAFWGPAFAAPTVAPGLIASATLASEPDPVGDWVGALATPVGALRIIVHIRRVAGGYSGTLDSPDQDTANLALSAIVVGQGRLAFTVPAAQATYRASWDVLKRGWDGQFKQGSLSLPLSLARPDNTSTSGV